MIDLMSTALYHRLWELSDGTGLLVMDGRQSEGSANRREPQTLPVRDVENAISRKGRR